MSERKRASGGAEFNIILRDAPELPLLHVNALNLRYSIDEFFFTLGVVLPPEIFSPEDIEKIGTTLTAQPVVRFALSRATMEKFLQLMATQYQAQTKVLEGRAPEREAGE